ncbi:MAG: amino acid adenylation domain-containing protein [Edaphobacter sp.]|uniref:amino acid adenylation domain-containing protein n=1 Tax=Edaphobacter sp. TaxID=1934404 RepID=UPI002981DAF4|nr:amino acid adenylation domain-containing protein [Edaphobacter sp.]MDW5265515.1 amino acid adenylation domain-containing protein [Edaphobacter sp.]
MMPLEISGLASAVNLNPAHSLPLKGTRSAAYWPRRNIASCTIEVPSETLASIKPPGVLAIAATAVLCVLVRYWSADRVSVGLLSADKKIRHLTSSIALQTEIGTVFAETRDAIASEMLPAVPLRQPETTHNPLFGILVGNASSVEAFPDLRQDLSLSIDERNATLIAAYGSRLFDATIVDAFLCHVAEFVRAVCHRPGDCVKDTPYLSSEELRFIDSAGRGPATPQATELPVQELFVRRAAVVPEALAVEDAAERTTYRDLDNLSGRIAAGLVSHSVNAGDLVVVAMRPGTVLVATLLAILKIRATPVPIDYTFPPARINAILKVASAKVALTDGALPDRSLASPHRILIGNLIEQSPTPASPLGATSDDLAYVLFTSGSTGMPKGVAMRQRTLVNLILWQELSSGSSGARTLFRSSVAFDVGFQEIFSALCHGHTLVVASESQRADVGELANFISERKVTRIFVPPVSLIQMAEVFNAEGTPPVHLRHVIVAGEALRITPSVVRMFRSVGAKLTNQYGPTETHVATSYDLEESPLRWPQLPPIGRPIGNARVHILDGAGDRCPVGVAGEIAIGGVSPALGYLGLPEETGQRFVNDPFAQSEVLGAVMYRTGDIGQLNSNGLFEFIGRRDSQVKLRGYRIELGDVEAHAMSIAEVKLAAATLRTRPTSGPYIALFVEFRRGQFVETRHIREHLLSRLPEHMVPGVAAIGVVSSMPLNANGKVDHERLPAFPELALDPVDADEGLLPQIKRLWQRYLNVSDIAESDDFLSLGGHSLLAIQVVSQINDRFSVRVPVTALLRGGSLRWFVDTVSRAIEAKSTRHPTILSGRAALEDPADPRLRHVSLANGTSITAPYPAEVNHYYAEIVERDCYLRHGIEIADGSVVVDVGANVGLFTLAILWRFPNCKVVSIEPHPVLAAAARRNFGDLASRITLLEIGLYDQSGDREFAFYPNVTGMSSFEPDKDADRDLLSRLVKGTDEAGHIFAHSRREIADDYLDMRLTMERSKRPVRRLSQVIDDLGLERIDLLKLDVHRGTERVLKGVSPRHWSNIRQIVVEHQMPVGGHSEVEHLLQAAGYVITTKQDDMYRGTNVVFTYARR